MRAYFFECRAKFRLYIPMLSRRCLKAVSFYYARGVALFFLRRSIVPAEVFP